MTEPVKSHMPALLQLPKGLKQELPPEMFLVQDRADEAQLLSEMKGEALKSYIYEFELDDGKGHKRLIRGLTIHGVQHAIRAYGDVKIVPCECCKKPVHIEDKDGFILAQAIVWDLHRNVQFSGTAICEKWRPFANTLAANKAERNAHRKLLPEKFISDMIAEYSKQPEKIQNLGTVINHADQRLS